MYKTFFLGWMISNIQHLGSDRKTFTRMLSKKNKNQNWYISEEVHSKHLSNKLTYKFFKSEETLVSHVSLSIWKKWLELQWLANNSDNNPNTRVIPLHWLKHFQYKHEIKMKILEISIRDIRDRSDTVWFFDRNLLISKPRALFMAWKIIECLDLVHMFNETWGRLISLKF